jgi:ABC-2 type transport system ATP-binding protein
LPSPGELPDLLILDELAASPTRRRHDAEVMERLRKYTTIFYSTHILEDVQRVSDTVAILNHGKLIAEAPIQELLAGGNSSVVYSISLKGEIGAVQTRVSNLPWVTSLTASTSDGIASWQVSISDEAEAEKNLLRLILEDPGLTVTQFGRKTYNLEEVFLSLVEGSEKNG